jgi:hypothetical protein
MNVTRLSRDLLRASPTLQLASAEDGRDRKENGTSAWIDESLYEMSVHLNSDSDGKRMITDDVPHRDHKGVCS